MPNITYQPCDSSIYALVDPRSGAVRYVGVATNPLRRLWRHMDDAKKGVGGHCQRWVASLLNIGLKPTMEILEAGVNRDREVFWIQKLRSEGADLTNLTDGGGGMVGYKHKPEFKEALRRRNTGGTLSPETRAAIAASLRGTRASPETRAKLSAVHKGRSKSDAMRAKLSATTKGRAKSPEHRAKLSAAALRRGAGRIEPRDALGRLLPHPNRTKEPDSAPLPTTAAAV